MHLLVCVLSVAGTSASSSTAPKYNPTPKHLLNQVHQSHQPNTGETSGDERHQDTCASFQVAHIILSLPGQ